MKDNPIIERTKDIEEIFQQRRYTDRMKINIWKGAQHH